MLRFPVKRFFWRSYSVSSSLYDVVDWKNRPGIWDEKDLHSMLTANRQWIAKTKAENPMYFDMNKAGHFPKMLWIGCVDARVPANELIGEPPGSVFVHRNIANQVIYTDVNVMSIIQFAVGKHKVKHVIVCGHYDCGGCKAAMLNIDHGSPLENWLGSIRDVFRLHQTELLAIKDMNKRQRRLVELNVIEQCVNLFKIVQVQTSRRESEVSKPFVEPQIHGCVFDPSTGELNFVEFDLMKIIDGMKEVYTLV